MIGQYDGKIPVACAIGDNQASVLGSVRDVKVIYPAGGDCDFRLEGGALKVKMPAGTCARLFEITLA